jgi:hypothetical protein
MWWQRQTKERLCQIRDFGANGQVDTNGPSGPQALDCSQPPVVSQPWTLVAFRWLADHKVPSNPEARAGLYLTEMSWKSMMTVFGLM